MGYVTLWTLYYRHWNVIILFRLRVGNSTTSHYKSSVELNADLWYKLTKLGLLSLPTRVCWSYGVRFICGQVCHLLVLFQDIAPIQRSLPEGDPLTKIKYLMGLNGKLRMSLRNLHILQQHKDRLIQAVIQSGRSVDSALASNERSLVRCLLWASLSVPPSSDLDHNV